MSQPARNPTQILSVGTAVPEPRFSQAFLAEHFSLREPLTLRFFRHPHIQHRHLSFLPPRSSATGMAEEESTGRLLEQFRSAAVQLSRRAVQAALAKAGAGIGEVDFLCCVTSTGFLVPGLSAILVHELGFRADCQRADIVGMGCSAGVNGLNVASSWCQANPMKKALLVCVEVCSAIYSLDDSESTALVNSLFGDGAAAALLGAAAGAGPAGILGFSSEINTAAIRALRFDWDDGRHRYRFVIDKKTPDHLAEMIREPLKRLFAAHGLHAGDVRRWMVHTGGAAILDRIQRKLGLSDEDLEHTRSVLRDHGNLSSASVFFSFERMLSLPPGGDGEFGVIVSMGPGLSVETAFFRRTP